MLSIKPASWNYCKENYVNGKIEKYNLNMFFNIQIQDMINRDIQLILCNKNALEDLLNLEQITLIYYKYFFKNGEEICGEHMEIPLMTNLYFCKKVNAKIKYKNDYIKIPLLNFTSKEMRSIFTSFKIRLKFHLNWDIDRKDFCEKYFTDAVLKLKQNKKHNIVLSETNYSSNYNKYIIYTFIRYSYQKKFIYDSNILSIYDYASDFYKLTDKYPNISCKMKYLSDGAIIIFKSNEYSLVSYRFSIDVTELINFFVKKGIWFYGPYYVFKKIDSQNI